MAVSLDSKISSKIDLNIASILVLFCSILSVYHSGTKGSQEITKKIDYQSKINSAKNYTPCSHDNR